MTFKVYCNIDLDDRKFEGRTQLATKVMINLKRAGFQFVSNPNEADLLHFHSSGVVESYKAYKLKKKLKVPCIYSLYSNAQTEPLMHWVNFSIQKMFFMRKIATKSLVSYSAVFPLKWRAYFLRKLDCVVIPSRYLQKKLAPNSEIIRFGIDVNRFKPNVEPDIKPDLKPNKKRSDKKIKVGHFGHGGIFKGLNDFVSASKYFNPQIESHIFMTQKFRRLENYVKKRNPSIHVHGFTPDIVKAYGEMDIIVLPYRAQIGTIATPLVLLEAMSCGKAIVTTDFDFVKEVVKDAAFVVPKYSPKKIAKAVNILAKNQKLREKLGKMARKIICQNHTEKTMLENYKKLYLKIKTWKEKKDEESICRSGYPRNHCSWCICLS